MNVLLVYPASILGVGTHVDRALRLEGHHVVALDSLFLGMRQLRDPLGLGKRFDAILAERATRPGDFDAALFVVDHEAQHVPTGALREAGVPTADWLVDPHLYARRPAVQRALRQYDAVFSAEKGPVEALAQAGIEASWLPLAADTDTYRPLPGAPQEWDLCLLGRTTPERDALVAALPGWRVWYGKRAIHAAANEAYNRSRASLNYTDHRELALRCFEVMASGCALLTPPLVGLADLFRADEHYLPVEATAAGVDQALRRLRDDPSLGKRLREAGSREVQARHTYRHRVRSMLAALGKA
jgi:spore maturation protein CgeB